MRAVLEIAGNTFREAIRDRVLYLFLGFAVLLLAATKIFGMLTVGDEVKVIKDLGLVGIQFFSMLISVMMSVTLISREMEQKTVFNILSKPVRRWQFLVGKYLGLFATIAANIVLMTVLLVIVLLAYQSVFDPWLFFCAAMTVLEMAVVAAFATLFSVLTKPMLGSVLTLAVFVTGHVTHELWLLTAEVEDLVARSLITVMYYLLPNLQHFNYTTEVVHQLPIPAAAVALSLCYGVLFTVLVVTLACAHFNHKDLM